MPSWKKVILSGSDAALNSLYVTTNVTASSFTGSFTGSFLGTSSYALEALTASYIATSSYTPTLQQVTTQGNTTTNSISVAGITNDGNLFLSGSNRLVYNNLNTNSMLFGFFDGGSIYGPYYQIFGNNYSNVTQRGSAEYVYDTRNGGESGFNIASFDGSSWTRKLRVSDTETQISGSLRVSANATITGSLNVQNLVNIDSNGIKITGSSVNSLQIVASGGDIPYISVSGSVAGPIPGKLLDVVYNAISVTANSTTTIAELPAPKTAGFTFDYIAYVGDGAVLQAGRAGVVKGILRNTNSGAGITKGFQINETTTLDLTDQGLGTTGLQFTIVQDTNGTSNQLVVITNNDWPYIINYTLTIYYNPTHS